MLTDAWKKAGVARRRILAWGAGKDLGTKARGLPEPQREQGGNLGAAGDN